MERAFETGDQANLRFRLMLNEFVRPSGATARVVDVVLRPVYDRLREIVGAILKLPPDDDKTRLCVHSILGQVAHFAHSRQMLGLLWPEMKMTPAQRELVAEHITQFSLAYLNGMRSGHPRSAGPAAAGQRRDRPPHSPQRSYFPTRCCTLVLFSPQMNSINSSSGIRRWFAVTVHGLV